MVQEEWYEVITCVSDVACWKGFELELLYHSDEDIWKEVLDLITPLLDKKRNKNSSSS